jgi:hypothetical protein
VGWERGDARCRKVDAAFWKLAREDGGGGSNRDLAHSRRASMTSLTFEMRDNDRLIAAERVLLSVC